jgi:hypothetical protein
MAWTQYKAIQAQNAAQLTQDLVTDARAGWKPILLAAGSPGSIVVILEHVPGGDQQK